MRQPAFSQSVFSLASVRHLLTSALTLALVLAVSACSTNDSQPLITQADRTAHASTLDVQALLSAMLRPAAQDSAAVALAAAPAPISSQHSPVRNLHRPNVQDTVETRTYQDATVEVYEAAATGATFIKSITVSAPGHEFMGLSIGMPLADAVHALAENDARHAPGTSYTFFVSIEDSAPAQISLQSENGNLSGYTVTGYLD